MKRTKNIILVLITVVAALVLFIAGLSADNPSFGLLRSAIPAGIWLILFTYANTKNNRTYYEY